MMNKVSTRSSYYIWLQAEAIKDIQRRRTKNRSLENIVAIDWTEKLCLEGLCTLFHQFQSDI